MSFKRYINSKDSAQSFMLVIYFVLMSLCLSACSVKPDLDKNHSDTPEETIVEQKEKDANHSGQTLATNVVQDHLQPSTNLYLQQQIDNPISIGKDVQKDYQQALILMTEGKWQQAQNLFEQVILKQPNLSGIYVNQAIIAKQHDKLDDAQLLLTKAIEINSFNLYAHHLQGQVYRLQGEFEKSEQSYIAALAIWPDFAEAHASMAILLELYRGRLLEAHTHYRAYLMLKPEDEEVKRWLAGLEIKIKRAGLELPKAEKVKVTQINMQSMDKKSLDVRELDND